MPSLTCCETTSASWVDPTRGSPARNAAPEIVALCAHLSFLTYAPKHQGNGARSDCSTSFRNVVQIDIAGARRQLLHLPPRTTCLRHRPHVGPGAPRPCRRSLGATVDDIGAVLAAPQRGAVGVANTAALSRMRPSAEPPARRAPPRCCGTQPLEPTLNQAAPVGSTQRVPKAPRF